MAASPSRTLQLKYLGDASQLSKTTKNAKSDISSFGDRVKGVGKKVAAGFAIIGGAAIAMGKTLFDAFETAQTANARIENLVGQLGNFEGSIGDVTQRLIDQAEATAELTGVDRNLIKESQGILLTFGNINKTAGDTGGTFDRATQAAVDLAAAGFGSVDSAANQLGKALEDPIRGLGSLREVGVTFTAEQEELIKSLAESNDVLGAQDLLLKAVEGQVGGTAEATANSSDIIRQKFGLLLERIAGPDGLGPAFEFLADKAIEFVDKFGVWWDENGDDVIQGFKDFAANTADLYGSMKNFVGLVIEELRADGAFARLELAWFDLKKQAGDTGEAFQTFIDSISGSETEEKASFWARIVQWQYIEPLEGFIEKLEIAFAAIEKLLGIWTRLVDTVRNANTDALGDLGFAPPGSPTPRGFNPNRGSTPIPDLSSGAGQRQTGNVIINVEGAIDREGTARTVERVLTDASRRTGGGLF